MQVVMVQPRELALVHHLPTIDWNHPATIIRGKWWPNTKVDISKVDILQNSLVECSIVLMQVVMVQPRELALVNHLPKIDWNHLSR